MAFWIPMAIGAGVGLMKNKSDKEKADRMNQAAATQTMYSPHTGMGPGQITQAPSGLEAAMQGAMAGASMGSAMGSMGGAGAAGGSQMAVPAGSQMTAGVQGSSAVPMTSDPFAQSQGMFQQQNNPWLQQQNLMNRTV